MPLFLRMQVVSAKGDSNEDIDAGEVTRTCLLAFGEDDELVLKALDAANAAAMPFEPDETPFYLKAGTEQEKAKSWRVECPKCGLFEFFGPEPVTCPRCGETDIETSAQ